MPVIKTGIDASDSSGKILIRTSGNEVGLLVARDKRIVSSIWITKNDWRKMMGKLHSVL